ncbi:hypothetical protein [Streptomyces gibsoniae]|uniref:Uncharacterized protein n=1 Tax=Streptomyces gibsoniae TaxID=3075529 RepID=A0ABU2U9L6_9ACTN|nr:hypothetical protein [Streptomyces sp. DSM 41699]MDT0469925.1 hypothetical protein [Streptomyces sp. DSM 41699]
MSSEAEALRDLLRVVVEALTLPSDVNTDRRIVDRAMWVQVTVKGALKDAPEDLAWNAEYLRRKLTQEEAKRAR